MKSALFLDRDGTLIQEKNYLSKLEDICFFEDVPQTLKKLKQKGFLLLLVTNQSAVARELLDIVMLKRISLNCLLLKSMIY